MVLDYKKDKQNRLVYDKIIDGKRCMLRAHSEKELQQKYKKWVTDVSAAKDEAAKGPLFETVAAAWWEDTQQRVRVGTVRCYKSRYQMAVDEFKGQRIRDIEPYQITAFLSRLAQQDYAKKSISNQKIVLNNIFRFWINSPVWHGDRNPVLIAQLPKGTKTEERQPPTELQLQLVKQHPEGFGFTAHLIMYTGCRLAEANALQVKDIFPEKKVFGITGAIRINKACPWKGNIPYLEQTKTESGIRWVPIFSALRPLLMQRIAELQPEDYLLSRCSTPLTKSQYDKRWAAYLKELGLAHQNTYTYNRQDINKKYECTYWVPDVTAHQFRHELATNCFEAGVPELVAQKILGHADISTTHRIYTHIRDRMLTENAAALDELLTQNSRTL